MGRRIGSRDRKKRKQRKFKRSVKYMPFPKNPKGRKDAITISFVEIRPMSMDGYLRFKARIRPFIKHETYTPLKGSLIVPVNQIDTKDKVVDFVVNALLREGDFLVRGYSKANNRFKSKPVKICRVRIKNNEYGLYGQMTSNYRLWRYWFWKG